MKNLKKDREKRADVKKNLLAELLNNIKMLKLYGWEQKFNKRVQDARDDEMIAFRK